jgi:uridylate kinase
MAESQETQSYRRVLLKISGELLCGDTGYGIDHDKILSFAETLKPLLATGLQLAIVVGAGNICRGREFVQAGFDQISADHIGMIATTLNAIALANTLKQVNINAHVRSALPVDGIVDRFRRAEGVRLLESGSVLICAGGTGSPLVTTDSAAALRAIELKADILLKATKVNGVYSADPMKDDQATLFSHLSYTEVIQKDLKVMDLNAFCLCREHGMAIRVFNMNQPGSLANALLGKDEGTLIDEGE